MKGYLRLMRIALSGDLAKIILSGGAENGYVNKVWHKWLRLKAGMHLLANNTYKSFIQPEFNQAKTNRDYYWVRGQYAEARKWENIMETYKQK